MKRPNTIIIIAIGILIGIGIANVPGVIQTYRAGLKAQADHQQFLEELELGFMVGSK